jgi:hypothetical protein
MIPNQVYSAGGALRNPDVPHARASFDQTKFAGRACSPIMPHSLVIFDLDGTLVDSFPWFVRNVNDVAIGSASTTYCMPRTRLGQGWYEHFARRANLSHLHRIALSGKSQRCSRLSRTYQEGRLAIVTDVGCGMRWTHIAGRISLRDERRMCERRSRVVLALRCRR